VPRTGCYLVQRPNNGGREHEVRPVDFGLDSAGEPL